MLNVILKIKSIHDNVKDSILIYCLL